MGAGGKIASEAASEAAEAAAKEIAGEAAESVGKEIASEAAEKVGKEAAEKAASEAAQNAGKKGAEAVAGQAAESASKEGAEAAGKEGAEKAAGETAKAEATALERAARNKDYKSIANGSHMDKYGDAAKEGAEDAAKEGAQNAAKEGTEAAGKGSAKKGMLGRLGDKAGKAKDAATQKMKEGAKNTAKNVGKTAAKGGAVVAGVGATDYALRRGNGESPGEAAEHVMEDGKNAVEAGKKGLEFMSDAASKATEFGPFLLDYLSKNASRIIPVAGLAVGAKLVGGLFDNGYKTSMLSKVGNIGMVAGAAVLGLDMYGKYKAQKDVTQAVDPSQGETDGKGVDEAAWRQGTEDAARSRTGSEAAADDGKAAPDSQNVHDARSQSAELSAEA